MSSTRFNRNTPVSSTSAGHAHVNAGASEEVSDLLARHQELQQRAQQLSQRRMRREVQLESVHAADKALRQQAEALGVKTLEELEALIETQEREDREALDRFEEELNAEAARLDAVDRELSALDDSE